MTADQPLWRENVGAAFHARSYRRLLKSLVGDHQGIVAPGDLAVTAAGSGLAVVVAEGGAVIHGGNNATQGSYFVYNDAALTITLNPADGTNPRIDLIVAQITDTEEGDGADNAPVDVITKITGTPNASPVAPSVPSTALVLKTVRVDAGATTLTAPKLTGTPTLYDTQVMAWLTSTSVQLVPDSTWSRVADWAQNEDAFGLWPGSGFEHFTIPAGLGGLYYAAAGTRFDVDSHGQRIARFNCSVHGAQRYAWAPPASSGIASTIGGKLLRLSDAETISNEVFQDSGHVAGLATALNLAGGIDGLHYFQLTRLGN